MLTKITYRYSFVIFGLALLGAILVELLWRPGPLPAWLAAANVAAFLAYAYDKAIAGTGQMRVPEAVLLALAFSGGSPGALAAMLAFHHKTSKASFQVRFWLIVALQIVLLALYGLVLRPALGNG